MLCVQAQLHRRTLSGKVNVDWNLSHALQGFAHLDFQVQEAAQFFCADTGRWAPRYDTGQVRS